MRLQQLERTLTRVSMPVQVVEQVLTHVSTLVQVVEEALTRTSTLVEIVEDMLTRSITNTIATTYAMNIPKEGKSAPQYMARSQERCQDVGEQGTTMVRIKQWLRSELTYLAEEGVSIGISVKKRRPRFWCPLAKPGRPNIRIAGRLGRCDKYGPGELNN